MGRLLESHLGEAGQVGDATGVVLVASQENIPLVSPGFSPAAEPTKKLLSILSYTALKYFLYAARYP